ncbi:hypothetical protein [Rhizobium viscosum]|uniref:Lipoprotein n=1 Tax=Rhizobium viscosum TaxID=1673 RepID=A0ABR9II49_RHIVS|nr:hypothetical protein [Rhizobium viscosum]MBE1502858.1 hypothetical protein [Rhizobium viscosum]
MSRFRALVAAGGLIGISLLTACATPPNSYGSASGYVPGDSMNRACEDGFRPRDGRSCSY